MSELIERSAVLHDLESLWDYSTVDGITASTVLKQVMTDVRNVPTVDAVPVVHGRWIFNQYDANPRIGNWHCSECGQITIMPHYVCNYCPNCGAKMDGDDNGKT